MCKIVIPRNVLFAELQKEESFRLTFDSLEDILEGDINVEPLNQFLSSFGFNLSWSSDDLFLEWNPAKMSLNVIIYMAQKFLNELINGAQWTIDEINKMGSEFDGGDDLDYMGSYPLFLLDCMARIIE
jgi:hypothetical protein